MTASNTTSGWLSPFDKCGTTDVSSAYTVNLTTDDVVFANAGALPNGTGFVVTVPTPTAADACKARRITIKRTDNNPQTFVRVQVAGGASLDGAPNTSLGLWTTTAHGIISGDSVTLVYQASANSWRVV